MDIIRVLQEYWPFFLQSADDHAGDDGVFPDLCDDHRNHRGIIQCLQDQAAAIHCQYLHRHCQRNPLLVQVFIMYYGLTQFLQFQWPAIGGFTSAFVAGVVTLSFNAGPIWRRSSAAVLSSG